MASNVSFGDKTKMPEMYRREEYSPILNMDDVEIIVLGLLV